MIPVKLKLSNFTSYGENPPNLDFTKFKLAAISGLNGAGKSSLLDSLTWCIWGTSRAGDFADALIHSGTDEMWVEFSFELDGGIFTIKRSRFKKRGGSTALELWSGSTGSPHNLTEGTIKATQEKIIQLLHLTFETFTNSAYIRQGHADEFTTKGPTDRKRVLSEILGLDHYDKLEEKAKEKSKESHTKLQLLNYQLLEIEAELSKSEGSKEKKITAEKKINQTETQILALEKELKNLRQQQTILNTSKEQQNKLRQTLMEVQNELNEILIQGKNRAEKIKQLETSLKELPDLDEKLKELKSLEKEKGEYSLKLQKKLELENKLTSVKSSLDLKNQQKETLEKTLGETTSHLTGLEKNNAKCPTCQQIIDKDQKQKVKREYLELEKELKRKIADIKTNDEQNQIQQLKKDISAISYDDHKYRETVQKLAEISDFTRKREELIAAQATLETEKQIVSDLRILFSNKKSQVEKLETDVKTIPNLEKDLAELEERVEQKERQLNNLRSEQNNARNLLGMATELISRIEQLEQLAALRKAEKSKLQKEKGIFDELSLAFGKKGIQAMIIEAAIPEIEEETNLLLGRLTEERMKIALQTQKETKTLRLRSGQAGEEKIPGIIETLDIIISDEMGERPYELYSVDGSELVYIREDGQIKSMPIEQLWSKHKTTKQQGEYELQNTNIKALCYVKGKAIWKKVDKILRHRSPKKILEVKCGPGNYNVKLTKNHSVYVMTPDGLKIKCAEDIKAGDYLLSPRVIPQEKYLEKLDLSSLISKEFIDNRTINHKPLNWDESFIWSRSDQKIKRVIPIDHGWAKLLGIAVAEGSGQTAAKKKIPECIFNAPKEGKLAFLKGLIMGDGYVKANKKYSKSETGITTVSVRLAGELLFLCRQLGIWARLEKHGDEGFKRGMNHQKSYRVVISGKKNLEILGFGEIVSDYDTVTKYEGIPYDLVGVSRINSKRFPRSMENQLFECGIRRIPKSAKEKYLKIQNLVSDWNILEVKEINEINPTSEYVYDLMVPGNNSFVAGNGALLVHNSGGEAFRVNFALRLAISKLLTHRAGAKLQFLVIDEGFGSQDAPGRAKLVEAIDTIKDDFEKILIITHMDELKEEFPVRIEVSKNTQGSTFAIVGV